MSKKREIESHVVELDYHNEVHIITVLHQNDENIYGIDTVSGSLKAFEKKFTEIIEVR
jgi:hypothetical protein